jgi:hypothetical protein
MKIVINKNSTVAMVQQQFNEQYPFLKVVFLKNIGGFTHRASIRIDAKRTVSEIEKDFKQEAGVSVKIFRRSGNVLVETSLTSDWTLESQNKEGEQISAHFVVNTTH